jgi:hypothetical protein
VLACRRAAVAGTQAASRGVCVVQLGGQGTQRAAGCAHVRRRDELVRYALRAVAKAKLGVRELGLVHLDASK